MPAPAPIPVASTRNPREVNISVARNTVARSSGRNAPSAPISVPHRSSMRSTAPLASTT
ncbi:Uncharacterised protein [Mycobacterium tuberculosis]|uniref:Uncharacterized protein n=1 Tax=Mycobacterium tuberculosis TaxID=1773 RepID=A0A916LH88_MYCTX|nr:Uncharacterised protein [Mycobacterium tuberculosis]CPB89547.1 Uncharacterised protein [Mycobacterium tuberculosis]